MCSDKNKNIIYLTFVEIIIKFQIHWSQYLDTQRKHLMIISNFIYSGT